MVVTDHSPATAAEKGRGDGDLQQAWGGIAGLQVGFTAVVDEARRRGIGPEAVSRWMSRATADLVGLGAKGRIEAGADADLVVLDEAATTDVDVSRLAHRNPISAYDGRSLAGAVTTTVLRGELLDRDDACDSGPDGWWSVPARERDADETPLKQAVSVACGNDVVPAARAAAPPADGARPDHRAPPGAPGDVAAARRAVRPGDDRLDERHDGRSTAGSSAPPTSRPSSSTARRAPASRPRW